MNTPSQLYLHHQGAIRGDLLDLAERHPAFSMKATAQDTAWPYFGPDFATLVHIIAGQQISTSAALAIRARLTDAYPVIDEKTMIAAAVDDLRALGLSGRKVEYIKGLAEACQSGVLNLDSLQNLDNEGVASQLTALRGFGTWSAHMYLIFGMARPDVWPVGDLGLREGLRVFHQRDQRPDPQEAQKMGTQFSGRRTAATLHLWRLLD